MGKNWFKMFHELPQRLSNEELKVFVASLKPIIKYLRDSVETYGTEKHYNWMLDIRILKHLLIQTNSNTTFIAMGMGHWDALKNFLAHEGYTVHYDSGIKIQTSPYGKPIFTKSYADFLKTGTDPMGIPVELFERFADSDIQKSNVHIDL